MEYQIRTVIRNNGSVIKDYQMFEPRWIMPLLYRQI